MSGFFNLGRLGVKVNKGAKAINKVAPKAGKDLTKKYLQSTVNRNKESKKIFEANNPSKDRNKASQEIFKKSKGE